MKLTEEFDMLVGSDEFGRVPFIYFRDKESLEIVGAYLGGGDEDFTEPSPWLEDLVEGPNADSAFNVSHLSTDEKESILDNFVGQTTESLEDLPIGMVMLGTSIEDKFLSDEDIEELAHLEVAEED